MRGGWTGEARWDFGPEAQLEWSKAISHMSSSQAHYYLKMAAECEQQAKHTNDSRAASQFLNLAAQWRELADEIDRPIGSRFKL